MTYKEEYLVKNIKINTINKIINNYFLKHKKKVIRSKIDCRIDSTIEKSNKYNKVDLYITLYSEKKDVTHNYYLKFPKPMIETKMLQISDKNRLFIKSLGAYLDSNPLVDLVIFKYWGYIKNKDKLVLDYNWYKSNPKHPSQELLDFLRSC